MKKLTLTVLAALLLAGCTIDLDQQTVSKRKLFGDWVCTTQYTEHNFETINNLSFNRDGSLSNKSSVIEPIGKPFFVYDISGTGMWQLNGNQLSYTLTPNAVKRNHTVEANDAISMDSRYKDYEKDLFNKYSKRINKRNTINFIITSLRRDQSTGKDMLSLIQQTGQNSYGSSCIRK